MKQNCPVIFIAFKNIFHKYQETLKSNLYKCIQYVVTYAATSSKLDTGITGAFLIPYFCDLLSFINYRSNHWQARRERL